MAHPTFMLKNNHKAMLKNHKKMQPCLEGKILQAFYSLFIKTMIVNKSLIVGTLWKLYIHLREYSFYASADPAIQFLLVYWFKILGVEIMLN